MANKYADWNTLGKRGEEIAFARAVEEAKATFGLTEGPAGAILWAGIAEALSGTLGTGEVEISAHEAASDPHPNYQLESAKGAASGYASLDGSSKVPIAELPTGTSASTVCLGNDARLSDARTPITHTHDDRYFTEAEMTTSLAGKADSSHNHDERYYTESEVDTALAAKAATSHSHDDLYFTEGEVTALLAGKAATSHTHDDRYYTETEVDTALALKSNTGHTHAAADITSGTIAFARIPTGTTSSTVSVGNHAHDDRYFTEAEVTASLATKAALSHTHAAADIVSGTIAIARIPTGTSGTTVALGNHTHALTSSTITGILPVSKGGTGLGAVAEGQIIFGTTGDSLNVVTDPPGDGEVLTWSVALNSPIWEPGGGGGGGTVTGTGTTGKIAKWTASSGIGDSILSEAFTTVTVAGTLDATTLQEGSVAISSIYSAIGHSHAFSAITSKPTTLAGYGITDAYTETESDAKYLPLTGGTLTGALTVSGGKITLDGTDSTVAAGSVGIAENAGDLYLGSRNSVLIQLDNDNNTTSGVFGVRTNNVATNVFAVTEAGAVTGGTYNGQTISSGANFTGSVAVGTNLTFGSATGAIVPGSTSLLIRNNANSVSNLVIENDGDMTNRDGNTMAAVVISTSTPSGTPRHGTLWCKV